MSIFEHKLEPFFLLECTSKCAIVTQKNAVTVLQVMDKHMSILAKQHVETRFIKVHAEKAPFLTEKLRVVVLPTLALVKNAKVEDYVVGFDELGGKDDFSTEDLEERIAKAQVIFLDGEGPANPSKQAAASKRSVRQSDTGNSDSD
uniref:Thioredoxin domain-containing protein n=1 Tax=Aegilops tauschii TaxID=37682 RepID=N1QX79_AEGTA